jgi:hypothetical protein
MLYSKRMQVGIRGGKLRRRNWTCWFGKTVKTTMKSVKMSRKRLIEKKKIPNLLLKKKVRLVLLLVTLSKEVY